MLQDVRLFPQNGHWALAVHWFEMHLISFGNALRVESKRLEKLVALKELIPFYKYVREAVSQKIVCTGTS